MLIFCYFFTVVLFTSLRVFFLSIFLLRFPAFVFLCSSAGCRVADLPSAPLFFFLAHSHFCFN